MRRVIYRSSLPLPLPGFSTASAVDITGAGATFPFHLREGEAYKQKTASDDYQSIGSVAASARSRPRPSTSARPTCHSSPKTCKLPA